MENEITIREEFESNTIAYPKKEALEELRKKVKYTCEYLDSKTLFDFDRTKNTDAYKRLNTLLKQKGLPQIGVDTLQKFFRSDETFIKDGEEVFSFRRRILAILGYFVENFGEKIASKADDFKDKTIRSLLYQLNERNKSNSTVETTITVNENGDCEVISHVFIHTLSDIANVRVQCFSEDPAKPIKVVSIDAWETMSKNKLCIYTYDENDYSYHAFIVFPNILSANSNYNYTYRIHIQGDFDNLVKKKYTDMERFIVPNRYKSIVEFYRFPNSDFFKNLTVRVASHPNPALRNKKIKPTIKDGYKIYEIDYGDISNTDIPIKFEMLISENIN